MGKFGFSVFLLLLVAKLCGAGMSWWIVLLPFWILPAVAVGMVGAFVFFAFIFALLATIVEFTS